MEVAVEEVVAGLRERKIQRESGLPKVPWWYLRGGWKSLLDEDEDESRRWMMSAVGCVSADWPGGNAGEPKRSVGAWLGKER